MTLLWSDEFDGPAGTPPDPAWWSHELDAGNDELQTYTADLANAALDGDGNLAITARASPDGCTSARLITKGKFAFRYGRVETRLKVPRGAGLWPAVWALGEDIDEVGWPRCGEIDVMEHVGREPRRAFGTIHCPGHAHPHGFGGATELTEDLADGFHVFAVEWRHASIEWSLDGHSYHAATPADVPGGWVFDHPFFLLINLAVGGDLGGPVDAELPRALLVDYVRVSAAD